MLSVGCKHSFLFGVPPGVQLLGHRINPMFIFEIMNSFEEFLGCPCFVGAKSQAPEFGICLLYTSDAADDTCVV